MSQHDAVRHAARRGDVNLLHRLLEGSAADSDSAGGALRDAVATNQRQSVLALLSHGVNPNHAMRGSGWTALFYAALNADANMVKLLLLHGANASSVDNLGNTPSTIIRAGDAKAGDARIARSEVIRAMFAAAVECQYPSTDRTDFTSLPERLGRIEMEAPPGVFKPLPPQPQPPSLQQMEQQVDMKENQPPSGSNCMEEDASRAHCDVLGEVPETVELSAHCKSLLTFVSSGVPASRLHATDILKRAHISAVIMLLKDQGSADNVVWALDRINELFPTPEKLHEFMRVRDHEEAVVECMATADLRVMVMAETMLTAVYAPGTGPRYAEAAQDWDERVAGTTTTTAGA